MIVFDIETGPLPDEELFALADPFEPPPHPGEFDPASVKCGGLGPEKAAAKIADAKAKHAAAIKSHAVDVKAAKSAWEIGVRQRACLDARLGQVLAIGIFDTVTDDVRIWDNAAPSDMTEVDILAAFWRQYSGMRSVGRKMVGHYIHGFDLPFLLRRSWLHGLTVPTTAVDDRGYFDSSVFIDTCKLWQCGTRDGNASLDKLCKAMGVQGKPEATVDLGGEQVPVDGANFWRLFQAGGVPRQVALEYLGNDLRMCADVADRMCLA